MVQFREEMEEEVHAKALELVDRLIGCHPATRLAAHQQ